ncbi:YqcI/YcgG family protein [Nocardiopsis sp. RSe5-2]|uniref:YqcI/YcgG family protein n=1 Tax=Nocardiopsis endophytica TaxID=3018445 RepID=A0ABT4U0D4_9ACTN|nr:YqcI/YcgG family protein [Nocardiopsis endophytica]MDA2810391.1 YqcI/YcgG family protein [Nocardiopsis endophytica]
MSGSMSAPVPPRAPGDWKRRAEELFTERLLDERSPFPCVFGVDALRRGTLRFAFVDDTADDPDGADDGLDAAARGTARALGEYTAEAPEIGRRTSLVVVYRGALGPHPGAGPDAVKAYRDRFWDLLQRVHALDTHPWPDGIPHDPESPTWEFCFAGTPMFVVVNTPAHERRRSRGFPYFCITFQPRFVFEGLEGTSPRGRNARRIIRGRLDAYDEVPPAPVLGDYGTAGNREWTQYFLEEEEGAAVPPRCPFSVRAPRAPGAQRAGEG